MGERRAATKSEQDQTEMKLLAAGMRLFGERGFKATTTRMIAEEAGSNIGSIAYYFGNKKSLYLAIVRHIAQRMQERFDLASIERRDQASGDLTPAAAIDSLKVIVTRLVRTFVAGGEAEQWLRLVLREQTDPSEAYGLLYEGVFERVYELLSARIARLRGLDAKDPVVAIESHALIGQIVFFLVGKTPLLKRLGRLQGYDQATRERIESVVLSNLSVFGAPMD